MAQVKPSVTAEIRAILQKVGLDDLPATQAVGVLYDAKIDSFVVRVERALRSADGHKFVWRGPDGHIWRGGHAGHAVLATEVVEIPVAF